jgi:hypothetical protein
VTKARATAGGNTHYYYPWCRRLLSASASLCVLNQLDPLCCHLQPSLFVGLARRLFGLSKALLGLSAGPCDISFGHSSDMMFRLFWKSFRNGAPTPDAQIQPKQS